MADTRQHVVLAEGYQADGAITTNRVVMAGTNYEDVKQVDSASGTPIGIALHAASDNERVSVGTIGVFMVEAGGTISRGDLVESNASGQAISITIGSTTGDTNVVGTALDGAASGELVPVRVCTANTFVME